MASAAAPATAGTTHTSAVSPWVGGLSSIVGPYWAARASSICWSVRPWATCRAISWRTATAADADESSTDRSSQLGHLICASMASVRWVLVGWLRPTPLPITRATARTTSKETGPNQAGRPPDPVAVLRPAHAALDRAHAWRAAARAPASCAVSSPAVTGPTSMLKILPFGVTRNVVGGDETP